MNVVVFSAFHLYSQKWIQIIETPVSCDQTAKQDVGSATLKTP